ncbi:MAG: extracellular solute-binding protein [Clostridia bacterium]|nr:extracellular solute-binding protein [Clostridia bacterium]
MRMRKVLTVLLLVCFILVGCNSATVPKGPSASSEDKGPETTKAPENVEITVWTYDAYMGEATKLFEAKYPNIKVKLELFSYDDSNEKFLKALSDGQGPDALVIDSSYFGQYVGLDVLQDLLEEPFAAGKYKKDFPEGLWNSNLSLDGKKLLGFPIATGPRVTFYRADIMQQNGFPSDPEELGKFMEDPKNWLEIGKKLKKKDQYIMQWTGDVTELMGMQAGIFDRDFNFVRNTDLFVKGLDITKEAHTLTLESNIGFWTDVGKTAIQSGQLAMVYIGAWAETDIKNYAPETAGKWRITRLPFGLYGWSGSTIISMNAQSEKKEAAWKYIEYIAKHEHGLGNRVSIPGYIPARKNPQDLEQIFDFLGGQKAYQMIDKLADQMKEYPITPLDNKAQDIFRKGVLEIVEKNLDSSSGLNKIDKEVEATLSEEKKILLQNMGK